ncbi:SDR family oxidoreductase [Cyclobacterium sp.]|uniref:SDR family oxidoreductase n=1 Tax=Cyclobacterium sp. TaxID=1966343 RepID=UPI0019A2B2DE|nr:SDR family oxidoreductase [Cyclobacterium sp.]MBD3627827.1 SDR family oxidoreductase [Cyclobacterium sp.]
MENIPEQKQEKQPGDEHKMVPQPEFIRDSYKGSEKLKHKVAMITGGDSGIGRSVAVHFAREGADCCIVYKNEDLDALETKNLVEKEGRKCLLIRGDLTSEKYCTDVVESCISEFKRLDILVNNAAVQFPKECIQEISEDQLKETFEVNIFAMFSLIKAALKYMESGGRIINSTSVTAYRGSSHLVDYAATKGAITSLTRSLAKQLAEKGILVNGVAPGPIWTPLIPATFDEVSEFGRKTPLGRPGQPSEVGPAYVFLACNDASYVTGQVIHVNGGEVIGA